jgi:hypothetical protein
VFVLSDLDIGMNDWMIPKLTWDDAYRPDRGKVLTRDELEEIRTFSRYLDTDGDGIAARTLPGVHPKGAYFTRGSGHNKFGGYTEDADEYVEVVDRIDAEDPGRGARRARADHPPAPGARVGLVTIGGCHAACVEALDLLAADGIAHGLPARPRLPLRRRGPAVPRRARGQLHRRAEPRRRSCAACSGSRRASPRRSWSRCGTTAASR